MSKGDKQNQNQINKQQQQKNPQQQQQQQKNPQQQMGNKGEWEKKTSPGRENEPNRQFKDDKKSGR